MGKIGGKQHSKIDNTINLIFLTVMISLFSLDMISHYTHFHFIRTSVSLEIGVLLVSLKIVFMIHTQGKANHFQFWILNSIEFRINDLTNKFHKIDDDLKVIKDNFANKDEES